MLYAVPVITVLGTFGASKQAVVDRQIGFTTHSQVGKPVIFVAEYIERLKHGTVTGVLEWRDAVFGRLCSDGVEDIWRRK